MTALDHTQRYTPLLFSTFVFLFFFLFLFRSCTSAFRCLQFSLNLCFFLPFYLTGVFMNRQVYSRSCKSSVFGLFVGLGSPLLSYNNSLSNIYIFGLNWSVVCTTRSLAVIE